MNAKPFPVRQWITLLAVGCFSIALVAWGGQKSAPQKTEKTHTDTIPKNKTDKKVKDLDDVLVELDDAELKLNMDKMKKEIETAMKSIDMTKIKDDIDKAMKEIDMVKIKADIDKAMKEIDAAKIEQEIKASMAKIDWEKIKTELEEVKKIDMKGLETEMKKVEKELKALEPKLKEELKNAKVEIEKARVEIKEYKSFVDDLEKDGLINKKTGYEIEHKSGELFINGKKQPASVYNKYRSFLEKHPKISMKKTDTDFDIDND